MNKNKKIKVSSNTNNDKVQKRVVLAIGDFMASEIKKSRDFGINHLSPKLKKVRI